MARLDVDGDGCVDRGELLAALVDWKGLQGGDDSSGCAADFSAPAAAAATTTTTSSPGCEVARAQWKDWVGAAFDRLDADGSGCIDLAELAALVKSQSNSKSSGSSANDALREAAELLREADTDGDGRLSREEFEALLTEGGGAGDDALELYDSRRRRVTSSSSLSSASSASSSSSLPVQVAGLRAMNDDEEAAAKAAEAAVAA